MDDLRKCLYEFFVCVDQSEDLPIIPTETKLYIASYLAVCMHGCGAGRRKCCFCSDLRPVEEVYVYKDGKGMKKTNKRWLYYCPTCKNLGQKGKGPKITI